MGLGRVIPKKPPSFSPSTSWPENPCIEIAFSYEKWAIEPNAQRLYTSSGATPAAKPAV